MMSFQSMEKNYYELISDNKKIEDTQQFTEYLLTQDTMILPEWGGKLICSAGVSKKIHTSPELIKDKYFYKDGDIIYFIYSKYFEWIGKVKVFFDTTEYIKTQIIIVRISLIFMLLIFILQFFMGKMISKSLLKNLKKISEKVKDVDIHSNSKDKIIVCSNMPEDDEIRILAEALNTSYNTIDGQTEKLKQFLTDVSHEFKTPLMWMSSRLDVLEKKAEKNDLSLADAQRFFSLSRQNIHKLNGLLQSLFFLSRVENHEGCLVKTKISFKSYIEKKLVRIADSFSHKELSYELLFSDDISFEVEENTFSILLDNLLSNAMKFSPEKMKIVIQADKSSFSITDNGSGIPNEKREKIWDKFYRLDTNKEWFWVGLFLVKRIIDMYKWRIFVSSEKWRWTTFKVKIR